MGAIVRKLPKLSLSDINFNGTVLAGSLAIVMLILVMPFNGILLGVKDFKPTGGATTAIEADADGPVPVALEDTGPTVYIWFPA